MADPESEKMGNKDGDDLSWKVKEVENWVSFQRRTGRAARLYWDKGSSYLMFTNVPWKKSGMAMGWVDATTLIR